MVQDGTRNTRRKQKRIIKEINRVVDWLRQVAIKAQSFIQYYVLHKLSNGRQVVDKCDKVWLMRELNELEAFKSLLCQRRRRVMKSCLWLIEQEDPEFTIRLNLDNEFIQQLTDIINNVRRGLHFSRLFLSGDTLIDRSVCFQSDTASTTAAIRLFALLPNMSFEKKVCSV
jgi:hypothetical protein